DVVLVGRNARALEVKAKGLHKAYNVKSWAIVQDLAEPGAASAVFDQLEKQEIRIHTLINNAGFGVSGAFRKSDLATQLAMLAVNVTALTELTHHLLPRMFNLQEGRILNVASAAAFYPGPMAAVYTASKAYVLSFTEALWQECRREGISVCCLCPGATATGFAKRAKLEGTPLFRRFPVEDPARVALAGYEGLKRGKSVIKTGSFTGFSHSMMSFFTREFTLKTIANLNDPGEPKSRGE
ncbi:MAG TPA: SDR family NAD(P)-dependent oxidoreductase, partial [Candidatus Baltobacteraceae bacterium]|nr:SDR family NAD(P)-dependent oxidoreductase [Candidatus Baltobacteraceae bacterium]